MPALDEKREAGGPCCSFASRSVNRLRRSGGEHRQGVGEKAVERRARIEREQEPDRGLWDRIELRHRHQNGGELIGGFLAERSAEPLGSVQPR
jgi:hypothetical protein